MDFWQLSVAVGKNIAVIATCAFFITQLPAFRRSLEFSIYRRSDKYIMAVVFGLFSALGTALYIPIMNTIASHRIVGAVVGGLLGGPLVGFGAGLIGAITRYPLGGFTMPAAVTANVIVGFLSGLVNKRYGSQNITIKHAFFTALAGEAILKFLTLTMSKPFEAAVELEKIIAIPTIVSNCIGVVIFVFIVRNVFNEQNKRQAEAARHAMKVSFQTNDLLMEGLTENSARKIAEIICLRIAAQAVAVADASKVLSFIGLDVTDESFNLMQFVKTANERSGQLDNVTVIQFQAVHIAVGAIRVNQCITGYVFVIKSKTETISSYEQEIIQGITDVISFQLTQSKLQDQTIILGKLENNLLRAQINPHFLYNILGTINGMAGINPKAIRTLTKDLADLFRRTLDNDNEFITIAEELEILRSYIKLENARFSGRIDLHEEIQSDVLQHLIPILTIQPLVVNSVQHGVSKRKGLGKITVRILADTDKLHICVEDDGIGMTPATVASLLTINENEMIHHYTNKGGVGIKNLLLRLRLYYDVRFSLSIASELQKGTKISIQIPH